MSSDFVFVLMPFDTEFDRIYEDLIAPPFKEAGYDVRRADSVTDQQNILRDVVEGIANASLIVADLTSLNPNVMYELGIAHGMNKPTIMLTQSIAELPFDLRSYRAKSYTTLHWDAEALKGHLAELAANHKAGKVTFGSPVSDFARSAGIITPLNSVSVQENTDDSEVEGEDTGFLDNLVKLEDSQTKMNQHLNDISGLISSFDSRIGPGMAEIQSIIKNPDLVSATKKYEAVSMVAKGMSSFCNDVENILPAIRDASSRLNESTDAVISNAIVKTEADKEAARNLLSQSQELRATLQEGIAKGNEAKDVIGGFRGVTQQLNRATSRTQQTLGKVVEIFEVLESYASRIQNVIEERLSEET